MGLKKAPSRRITRVDVYESARFKDRGAAVEVHCRDEVFRDRVLSVLRTPKGKQGVKKLIADLLRDAKSEPRKSLMQPQIPSALLVRFKERCAESGLRKGHEMIRKALSPVFDLHNAKRKTRTNKAGKRVDRNFRDRGRFIERARALAKDSILGRFAFDAGSPEAKELLCDYISNYRLTQTEFFSALLERICETQAESAPRSQPAATGDALAASPGDGFPEVSSDP